MLTMAGVAVLAAIAVWDDLKTGDAVIVGGFVGLIMLALAIGLSMARFAARKRLIFDGNSLRLGASPEAPTIDLGRVAKLYRRRISTEQAAYTEYCALLDDGRNVRLFTEGAYGEQNRILSLLEERTGREFESVPE